MNAILKIAALATIFAAAAPAVATSANLFNTVEYRTNSLDALPQWQRALSKIEQEQKAYRDCAKNMNKCGSRAVQAWQAMIKDQRGARQLDQLQAVNSFINQWRYRADQGNYGRSDYWASPSEFFRRSGDCEDYAIAKYVTLRQMGFSADQLRLVVVKDIRRNLAHAVLAAYVGKEVYILDNLSATVRAQKTVLEYTPYYSVNEKARWAHAAAPASSKVAAAAKADAPASGRPQLKPCFPNPDPDHRRFRFVSSGLGVHDHLSCYLRNFGVRDDRGRRFFSYIVGHSRYRKRNRGCTAAPFDRCEAMNGFVHALHYAIEMFKARN